VKDKLCVVDIKKTVSSQRYILLDNKLGIWHRPCYDLKLGSGCNLGKDLSKNVLQSMPQSYNTKLGWGYDDIISYGRVVSVSASCSRCCNLISFFLYPYALWLICFMDYSLCHRVLLVYIYSIDTILYSYALPLLYIPYPFSSLCLSVTWALA